uniref:Putative sucraseferredoxin family protein n=1 Tax=Sphaerisporangium sp. SANK 60911 TaxID=1354075 RepID=V5YS29_9ACTN|nr:putative sucraseferredoxin family protein [Sphaerisporangium sp. SANK 60911]
MDEQGAPAHGCSYLAGLLGDPLTATATEARAWLLVEHPGPWGKDALADSDLPAGFVRAVTERMKATGVRVQLMSPPEGRAPSRCLLAGDPIPGTPWLASLPIDDLWSILDLDFAALADGRVPAGATPVSEPLYLVCANDRSDPCCGRAGPAVFAAVRERVGDRCRRTAHVGGHKYAANMVAFPYAVFYGRLDPAVALDVVTAHDQGLLYLDRYRGRSAYDLPEQAAEHFLRNETGHGGLSGLDLLRRATPAGDDRYASVFGLDGTTYEVVVSSRRRGPARLQSCTDARPTLPVEWKLDAVVVEPVGAAR